MTANIFADLYLLYYNRFTPASGFTSFGMADPATHRLPPHRFYNLVYGDWLRVLSTPAHSSWLNQAEILLKCFEVRYLQRGHWTSRQHLIDHLHNSTPEYNRLWAQPINWSWTRRDLRNWAEKKSARLC